MERVSPAAVIDLHDLMHSVSLCRTSEEVFYPTYHCLIRTTYLPINFNNRTSIVKIIFSYYPSEPTPLQAASAVTMEDRWSFLHSAPYLLLAAILYADSEAAAAHLRKLCTWAKNLPWSIWALIPDL